MCVYIQIHLYTHIYIYIHIYIHTYIHMYTFIYVHIYTHIYVYTHIYIYTHELLRAAGEEGTIATICAPCWKHVKLIPSPAFPCPGTCSLHMYTLYTSKHYSMREIELEISQAKDNRALCHALQHALQHTLQHALQHTLQHALEHTLQHTLETKLDTLSKSG